MKHLIFTVFFILHYATSLATSPQHLIKNGGYLINDPKNGVVTSHNSTLKYIPASIYKLLTTATALKILGPNYRFKTEFYLSPGSTLFIKGYGDPYLISEEIDKIAAKLRDKGLRQINNIVIDQSSYNLQNSTINKKISNNPYDAAISALGVNFNTTKITIDPNGIIYSGEKQTPLMAITKKLGRNLPPGNHRVNLGKSQQLINNFVGQLFQTKLQEHGIITTGKILTGSRQDDIALLHTHYSKKLSAIIPAMLLYSNNYMANQIFLTLGAQRYSYPATWLKAQNTVYEYSRNTGITSDLTIIDGAGLSPDNKISAKDMTIIVEKLREYSHLLPKHGNHRLKSGTMTGVYCYAGFLNSTKNSPTIVIMLNQEKNYRDQLLALLEEETKRLLQ